MACFYDLPAEMRNKVYEIVLQRPSTGPAQRQPDELALLSVNKEIHAEASSFFYASNTVTVNADAPFSEAATILPSIADRFVKFIRRFDLHCDFGEVTSPATQRTAKIIESLLRVMPSLKELYITLSSTISPFVNSRIDDSIMDATHPVVIAIRGAMRHHPNLVAIVDLRGLSFAAGTGGVQALMDDFPGRLTFFNEDSVIADLKKLKRDLVGQHASDHLMYLDPEIRDASATNDKQVSTNQNHLSTTISSISSSITELDTFSVSSFGRSPPTIDDANIKPGSDDEFLLDEDDTFDMDLFA